MVKLIMLAVLLGIARLVLAETAYSACQGKLLNPLQDINWDLIFPIRIAGVKLDPGQGSMDAPQTLASPFCLCPSGLLGLPTPGVVVTFHEPLYVEEIVKTPGCLSALGGLQVLSGYERLQADLKEEENSSARWQIHWYRYPIFALLPVLAQFSCATSGQFALTHLTELDPMWQDDNWASVFNPEAAIFTTVAAQTACMTDAAAATQLQPKDELFWCVGSWGPVYPLTGNANASVEHLQSANLVGAKFIARLARLGALRNTVGADAICTSKPMPIWQKSVFALDPVFHEVRHTRGIALGAATSAWEYAPPQAYPGRENITQVIFQEQQCCLQP